MATVGQAKYDDLWRRTWDFLRLEAPPLFIWVCIATIFAGLLRLCLKDHNFATYVAGQYNNQAKHFDSPASYITYGATFLFAAVLIIVLRLPAFVWRGLRSWWFGVTSGLPALSFVLTLCFFVTSELHVRHRLSAYLITMAIALILSVVQNERANRARVHVPNERDIQVSLENEHAVRMKATASDDPIETWSEDTLGRAALVDSLTIKLLISKAPVIALFGEFGSGKTSVLNLLREHLAGKAIVVSFSTWLPGSQETLTSYLLSDIASECQKEYIVPGLRRSARRIADALSETVPYLKGFLRLFPAPTQKDDIESLKIALRRLPRRVVVLLDELDRMQRDELLPLLKVVRGIASLPNLSFVCAAERKTLTRTVCESDSDDSNMYFEKFFPSSVAIPKPDPQMLQTAGVERLTATLRARSWFVNEEEPKQYREQLERVWPNHIAPWVRNLRAIGLLANDVSVAAPPLRRQVDAVDLTLIELLRHFKPEVHEIIARNNVALTGGESLGRGGAYHSEEELKSIWKQLEADLNQACEGGVQLQHIKGILGEMFPEYAKRERPSREFRPRRKNNDEDDKRICDPRMFAAYFRYDLPSAIFSAVEFENFVLKAKDSNTSEERRRLFTDELLSMQRGSLKRDDFLRKTADAIPKTPTEIGRDWVEAILLKDNELTYELMAAFGEAGHALRMIIRLGLELSPVERIAFLEKCIVESADDTLPVRIIAAASQSQTDFDLKVKFSQLYPSFVRRMRHRYGREVDAAIVDLSKSDTQAFGLWGMRDMTKYEVTPDPDDWSIQHEFWLRYIGSDRARLLYVFDNFLLPDRVQFTGSPNPFIEVRIRVDDLRQLAETLPTSPKPDDYTRRVETKMRRFLRGDYSNGVGLGAFSDLDEPDELTAPTVADE
jgi:hypothetical protein